MSKRIPKETPDPVDTHVGRRLKARRVGLRISQTDIGKKLGITFQQIQKYENGSNRVGASNLFKLADALKVNVSYFFEDMPKGGAKAGGMAFGEGEQDSFEHDPMAQPESIKLVHNYFRIANPAVRQQVFQLVKSMAENGGATTKDAAKAKSKSKK